MCESQETGNSDIQMRYIKYTFGLIFPAVLGAFIFGIIENSDTLLYPIKTKNWLSGLVVVFFCIEYIELSRGKPDLSKKYYKFQFMKHYIILFCLIQMMVSLEAIPPLIILDWTSNLFARMRLFWLAFALIFAIILFYRCWELKVRTDHQLSCYGEMKVSLSVCTFIGCILAAIFMNDGSFLSVFLLAVMLGAYIITLCKQGDNCDLIPKSQPKCTKGSCGNGAS